MLYNDTCPSSQSVHAEICMLRTRTNACRSAARVIRVQRERDSIQSRTCFLHHLIAVRSPRTGANNSNCHPVSCVLRSMRSTPPYMSAFTALLSLNTHFHHLQVPAHSTMMKKMNYQNLSAYYDFNASPLPRTLNRGHVPARTVKMYVPEAQQTCNNATCSAKSESLMHTSRRTTTAKLGARKRMYVCCVSRRQQRIV